MNALPNPNPGLQTTSLSSAPIPNPQSCATQERLDSPDPAAKPRPKPLDRPSARHRMNRILSEHDNIKEFTTGDRLKDFNTATITIAQQELFEILHRFDTRKLSKRLNEKPELFFPLINAFCNFSRLQLARDKFEWQKKQAEARQRASEQKQRARTPVVITPATVRSLRTFLQPPPVCAVAPAQEPAAVIPNAETARYTLDVGASLELGTCRLELVPFLPFDPRWTNNFCYSSANFLRYINETGVFRQFSANDRDAVAA